MCYFGEIHIVPKFVLSRSSFQVMIVLLVFALNLERLFVNLIAIIIAG